MSDIFLKSSKINLDYKTGEITCPSCTSCPVEKEPCVCFGDATECLLGQVCETSYTICKDGCTDMENHECPLGQKLQETQDSNLECSTEYSCDPEPSPDPTTKPTTKPTTAPTTQPPTTMTTAAVTTAPQGCRPESLGECDCSSVGCPDSPRCLIRVSESEVNYRHKTRKYFFSSA